MGRQTKYIQSSILDSSTVFPLYTTAIVCFSDYFHYIYRAADTFLTKIKNRKFTIAPPQRAIRLSHHINVNVNL